jgi:hypothetical protein
MIPGRLTNAQPPTCRSLRLAQKLRTITQSERLCRLDETLPEPRFRRRVGCGGRHVDLATKPAPHDIDSVGDAHELFRWPTGMVVYRSISPYCEHSVRGGQKVMENKSLRMPGICLRSPERVLRTVLIEGIPVVVVVVI